MVSTGVSSPFWAYVPMTEQWKQGTIMSSRDKIATNTVGKSTEISRSLKLNLAVHTGE